MPEDVIARACDALHLTQKQLAGRARINPSRISDVRAGRLAGFSRSDTRKLVGAFPDHFSVESLIYFEREGGRERTGDRGAATPKATRRHTHKKR